MHEVRVDVLTAARAEALFASDLSRLAGASPAEVATAIRRAVRCHGGTRGCACVVAAEFGEHPETAESRMRWALRVVRELYRRPGERGADGAA